MTYVSAKYTNPIPGDPPQIEGHRSVEAIDEDGVVWNLTEDSQVGEWRRYLADGGTIDPADVPVEQNILTAPGSDNLTGGPTIAEVFNVNH